MMSYLCGARAGLTVQEAAELAGVTVFTIYRMREAERLVYQKTAGSYLIWRPSVEEYAARRKTRTA